MTFINPLLSILELVWERAHSRLGQRAALALGVLLASTAICATLLYADGISIAGLRDRLSQEHNQATYDVLIKGAANIIDRGKYDEINDFIFSQAERTIGLPISRSGRHGWSKSLLVIPPGVDPAGKRSNLPTTRFQFYAGIEDQVEVIEGHFPHPAHDPQDTVEVMVTEKLAQELGLHPGDRFRVEDWTGSDQPMHVTVELAAIIRLRDPESNFWFYAPWFLDQAFTVPEETFFNAIALAFVPTEGEFTWVANFDEAAINPENAGRVLAGLDLFRFRLQEQLQKARLLTDLDDILKEYQRSSFILKALLILLGAPIVGIALYYIVMSSTMIVEGQKDEIAILKSRGASDGQLLGLFVAEGLIIGLAAVLLAPLLAIPLGRFIGRTTTFMVFDNPRSIPVFLRSSTFSYAGGAALLALLATLQPVLGAARETIVTYKQEAARPRKRSLVHRTYFDVVLMGLAALGYRLLTQRGTIVSRGPTGGLEFDPLLLVTPIVLVLGVALFALRLMPLLMRALACLWALTDSVSVLIALRGIARTHGYYPSLVLLLTFTLSVGLFTASVAGTFDANYSDQALYQTGADLRTAVFDFEDMRWETLPLSDYEAIPGVKTAMPALRYELIGREATVRVKGRLVAIDPDRFPQTAFWRHDFAEVPLDTLMATLKTQPEGLLVNPSFARKHRLNLGQRFDINIDGVRVDFVLSGYVNYFPTLYPKDGDMLIANLSYLSQQMETPPNEVWLRLQPGARAREQVKATLQADQTATLRLFDGHELTGIRQDDPLRTGLFGVLSVGFVVASLLSMVGFLLYAYLTVQKRALQFGVLRASGLSVGQLTALLAFEQLFLIGLGIVLGTALGAISGHLFTHFLQVSIIARESVPPFRIITPWLSIIKLYVILVLIFVAALAVTVQLLRRMRVHAVLRMGEQ